MCVAFFNFTFAYIFVRHVCKQMNLSLLNTFSGINVRSQYNNNHVFGPVIGEFHYAVDKIRCDVRCYYSVAYSKSC